MTSTVVLVLAVLVATAVEMVEALTIVLAAGATRGWRSALEGTVTGVVVLAVIVGVVGVPLVHLVPIAVLRVVIGGLLLVLGLGWFRKAVLRASGHKALHDEDAIYASTVAVLTKGAGEGPAGPPGGGLLTTLRHGKRDATGFVVAFKGVFLEGMEVVLIVLSLGASAHHLGLAALVAGATVVAVAAIGIVVARQLSEVPENTMKLAVGIMLSSFGVFWVGEGSGLHWPGSDLAILVLVATFLLVAAALTSLMRRLVPGAVAHRVAADVAVERVVGR